MTSPKTLELSPRARALPPSPIRKLVPLADRAKARGIHVFHLNIGQPDLPTPKACLAAVRSFSLPLVSYSPSQGEADCVQFWLDYYAKLGHKLEKQQVQVTTGGSEAILFALTAIASPGDEVLTPEPFYTNYRSLAEMVGVNVKPITTRPEDGYHLPPAAAIEKCLTPRTRAIILCNPSNPTGTVYTPEELERIAGIVRKHDLFWIADEVYREFVYGDEPARSALTFHDLADRVVIVDSVSKRFSACGARIGCLVSRNDEFMAACLRMGQARLSSPLLGQVLTAAGSTLAGDYFNASRDEYRRRRDLLHRMLNEIPGVFSRCPDGAFYTMARLPVPDAEEFASWLLTDFSLGGKTVMVAPGNGFYATPGLGMDEVRIAYVLKLDDIRESMLILRDALAAYPKRLTAPGETRSLDAAV